MLELPPGALPVRELSTGDVLYGDRVTAWRWEVLEHQSSGGDTLAGYLDGVEEKTATLEWQLYRAVKGSGVMQIADLAEAKSGMLRVSDLELPAARLRPVLVIDGLPEIPWGVFLFAAAPESWSAYGRTYGVELLDKSTVLDQDLIDEPFGVDTATPILEAVADMIASAGETIVVDATVTATLALEKMWPAGTSKLQIVNDLLAALHYGALWVDAVGNFRATPYVLPAERSATYELLNLPRELVDGETSIYAESWIRDRDLFDVPNKVIAIQSASGDAEPLVGVATNEDPNSPFSYQARGNRWKPKVLENVDVPDGTEAEIEAFLEAKARASLIASSAVQAAVEVKHLPVPARVGDVIRFENTPAGIDARHVLTSFALEAHPLGLMSSKLQEVIEL